MQRVFLASSGVLFLGSTGAFLLYVPVLSIVTVVCLLLGLMLMFGLGFQAGTRGLEPSELPRTGPMARLRRQRTRGIASTEDSTLPVVKELLFCDHVPSRDRL